MRTITNAPFLACQRILARKPWALGAAVILTVAVPSPDASAAAYAAYVWTAAQIQDLTDVTPAFHGGAGIDSITPIPNGIELSVTYRIGQESDPFAPNYGLGFARVSLQGLLGFGGRGQTGREIWPACGDGNTALSWALCNAPVPAYAQPMGTAPELIWRCGKAVS